MSLLEVVTSIIENRRRQGKISPSWVATEALNEINPHRSVLRIYPDIYKGCHHHLRQLARGVCRDLFEGDGEIRANAQHEMWPSLQWRYPTARSKGNEEPQYILLELMSKEDVDYNLARLRSEAKTKLNSADALEAWAQSRFPPTENAA